MRSYLMISLVQNKLLAHIYIPFVSDLYFLSSISPQNRNESSMRSAFNSFERSSQLINLQLSAWTLKHKSIKFSTIRVHLQTTTNNSIPPSGTNFTLPCVVSIVPFTSFSLLASLHLFILPVFCVHYQMLDNPPQFGEEIFASGYCRCDHSPYNLLINPFEMDLQTNQSNKRIANTLYCGHVFVSARSVDENVIAVLPQLKTILLGTTSAMMPWNC